MMMPFDETAKRRIRFNMRRGLLELDILFKRFADDEFWHLSDDELVVLVKVLEWSDPELLAILNQTQPAPDPEFEGVLNKIRRTEKL